MAQQNQPRKEFVPPSPADLTSRYLQRQTAAHADGLAAFDIEGDVLPYDAGPVMPIDSKLAWEEAVKAATCLGDEETIWKAPPDWPQLVAAHEPAYDLAFALGNFPQLVRSLHPLLQATDLAKLRNSASATSAKAPALVEWADKTAAAKKIPEVLLAVAGLRLAKQYDKAAEMLDSCSADITDEWRPLWDNEKAALAWHRGDGDEARRLWQEMPDSVPVLFNRGMAALFQGDAAAAKDALSQVVTQLPERSAWHHLARLYLTLAEARSK